MDFRFSSEEDDFRRTVRDWVEAKYPKLKANELEGREDHDGSNFPRELWDDLAAAGFFGIGIDEEHGGQGGGAVIQSIFMEEIARSLAGLSWLWGVTSFNAKSIQAFGSDELKAEFIPKLVTGEINVAIAVTEPWARHRPAGRDAHDGHGRRRRLPRQRGQDLVDHGPRRRLPAAAGHDLERPREAGPRQDPVPGRRQAGRRGRAAHPQARHALRGLLRGAARRRLRAGEPRDRRGRQGLVPPAHHAQQRADPGRRALHRRAARRARGRRSPTPTSARPSAARSPASRRSRTRSPTWP